MMHRFKSRKEANLFLHSSFCNYIEQKLIDKSFCSVAIPGGSSPLGLFDLLANRSSTLNKKLEWSRVKIFWVDERYVSHDHPDSNFKSAHKKWLGHYPEITAFPVRTDLASPKVSADHYNDCLKKELSQDENNDPYPLDLVLLGMGADGHVASLFPGTEEMSSKRNVIQSEHPESRQLRISLSYDYISRARHIIVPVFGQLKTELLEKTLARESYVPLSRILDNASSLEIINSNE